MGSGSDMETGSDVDSKMKREEGVWRKEEERRT